jgi:hypothetical protein
VVEALLTRLAESLSTPDLFDSFPQSILTNLMYLHVASSPLRAVKVPQRFQYCIPESCGVCSGGDGIFSACRRQLLTGLHCCRLAVVVCSIIPIHDSSPPSCNGATTLPFVSSLHPSSSRIKAVPFVYLGLNLSLSDYHPLYRCNEIIHFLLRSGQTRTHGMNYWV